MNYTVEYIYKGLSIIIGILYPILILLMRLPIGSSISAIVGTVLSLLVMTSYIVYTEVLKINN